MLVLQVARLDEYHGIYQKQKKYSKLVKSKEKCCFETVLFIKHLEKQQLLHVFKFGDGVLLVVAVWLLSLSSLSRFLASFCISHAVHTPFSTTYISDNKNTRISKMIDNSVIEKQKVQSYDLRIVAWYNGCQLKNTQITRQTQQEYAHTTHNPYYGCCAVKSNHQNCLLIA
jgi:hypothetical protein